jgi:undecaprenyl-diphosphatase
VTELDVQVFHWLHAAFSAGRWLAVMSLLTVVGSGWGAIVVVPMLAMKRWRRFGGWLAGVFATTAVLVFILKWAIRRRRPYLALPDVTPLVFEAPTDYSFPSGHAAGSFAFAAFVAAVALRSAASPRTGYLVGAGAMLLAAGVALSRVALGVHFPADVTAGALLGATVGAIGAQGYWRGVVTTR